MKILGAIVRVLGSFALAVVVLLLLLLIVFLGTLYQVDHGLYAAQQKYFNSFFVVHQFFGVLPLSGRQFMYGILGFVALFVVLQGLWSQGAAFAAAMLAAAIMTSKRWSPGLAWKRWRIARARARLSVIEGGAKPPRTKPKSSDEQRWLN